MPSFRIVDSVPRMSDNNLVDYDEVISALKAAATENPHAAAVIEGFTKSDAAKVVKSFKRHAGVVTHTRAAADGTRSVYVQLAPLADG